MEKEHGNLLSFTSWLQFFPSEMTEGPYRLIQEQNNMLAYETYHVKNYKKFIQLLRFFSKHIYMYRSIFMVFCYTLYRNLIYFLYSLLDLSGSGHSIPEFNKLCSDHSKLNRTCCHYGLNMLRIKFVRFNSFTNLLFPCIKILMHCIET